MSESPEAADLSPGDIVILEGSRLPQSDWQAESLALNLRKAGCAACICVRSKPPKAFQAACERERVALLGLGADCSPSRVARDMALALMNGADRDSGLEAEGPGLLELEDLEKEFERLSGEILDANLLSSPRVEAARNALKVAKDARAQEIRLLAEARSALARLSDREAATGEEIVVRALAVAARDREKGEVEQYRRRSNTPPLGPSGNPSLRRIGDEYLCAQDTAGGRQGEPRLAFSRRTVERIREHDERTGDGLLATLEAYFRNDRNVRKTAAELGIQRHTLTNRLTRIETLTDYPLRGEGRIGYELALVLQYWTKGRISH